MAGMNETEVSGELFEFGENRQFNAKIVGTRVDNPNIVESKENSSQGWGVPQGLVKVLLNIQNITQILTQFAPHSGGLGNDCPFYIFFVLYIKLSDESLI